MKKCGMQNQVEEAEVDERITGTVLIGKILKEERKPWEETKVLVINNKD